MSDAFEDEVKQINTEILDDRYKALAKLDPELARLYVIGYNGGNAERLRRGPPKNPKPGETWFTGGVGASFDRDDVDAVMDAVLKYKKGEGFKITEKEEKALLIILGSPRQFRWKEDAKQYMIQRIQEELRNLESSRPIEKSEAMSLLAHTNHVDFVSGGDKHLVPCHWCSEG